MTMGSNREPLYEREREREREREGERERGIWEDGNCKIKTTDVDPHVLPVIIEPYHRINVIE